jgi:NADH dehydrogenase (ubiquinone) 1 alpha subcomplex subunit 2
MAVRLSGGALRELRIHLCQKSSASSGAREFIEQSYVGIKKANPKFPILVRECSGIAPRVWAR